MDRQLEQLVWDRAKRLCEYCQLPAWLAETPFQIDHIIPRKQGGRTTADNLALSCFYCNSYKDPNLSGIDPTAGQIVTLFHPRRDRWEDHFQCLGPLLRGLTPVGRATITVLNINHSDAVTKRELLIEERCVPAVSD